jgi:CDP-paratose 2-epimerase
MDIVIVTGAGGVVGAATCRRYVAEFDVVVGVDNDQRAQFFGPEASTAWSTAQLAREHSNYVAVNADIRDERAIDELFATYGSDIKLIVHCAAQPSHDWAASAPLTDFTINANGTMVLLEATRKHAPEAVFIFTSTNKVYGDTPNMLPLVETESRWELEPTHRWARDGIDETMSIDNCKHSLFGVSKAAADLMVQEYGRYFGTKTVTMRGGCLTGPGHSGAQLHGFLAYLMKCAATDRPYTIFGYKGKQVRDNLHSDDLVAAFDAAYRAPRPGEVYNMGGGRWSDCSVLEAIELCETITGRPMQWSYDDTARSGDHIWWVSDTAKFREHFPQWQPRHSVKDILEEIYHEGLARWEGSESR